MRDERWRVAWPGVVALLVMAALAGGCATGIRGRDAPGRDAVLPAIDARHVHMAQLLRNTLEYLRPGHGLFDPASGYPREGWNNDPKSGLCLRGFTQLTAVGAWVELLGTIAAGRVNCPYLTREESLQKLEKVMDSLLADQQDPRLSHRGLLCNFMGFEGNRRVAPLASVALKKDFLDAFGSVNGPAVWRALAGRGWLKPWEGDQGADILRGPDYGAAAFTGLLAPFARREYAERIMEILDRRVLQIVYGDNANLAASVAKAEGALLEPDLVPVRTAKRIREKMECFLNAQRGGYEFLYDTERGLFRFGWNASDHRFIGWVDEEGVWRAGHSDYLINEFRGPTQFVLMRYGLPPAALRNLGFQIKRRVMESGETAYALAPWEGSAFQALGLSLFMDEMRQPGWGRLLENAVRINVDYSRAYVLPGFLSESYTGNGIEYSGHVGVPDIAVVREPRITNAPSLYMLGIGYSILPEEVERFVAEHWERIAPLMTDHGPWEGYCTGTGKAIERQTTVHVMTLLLGGVGAATEFMTRYLSSRGLDGEWNRIYPPGEDVDILAPEWGAAVWSPDGASVQGEADGEGYRLRNGGRGMAAVTWSFAAQPQGGSFSGGTLVLRYRNAGEEFRGTISLEDRETGNRGVANVIELRLEASGEQEAEVGIPLPATPGLTGIRRLALMGAGAAGGSVDLRLLDFRFEPDDSGIGDR